MSAPEEVDVDILIEVPLGDLMALTGAAAMFQLGLGREGVPPEALAVLQEAVDRGIVAVAVANGDAELAPDGSLRLTSTFIAPDAPSRPTPADLL